MGDWIRVLCVDDDPDWRDLTATALERRDERIAVETATSASEGLDALEQGEFDCVVSAYEMPDTDGIEFLEQVRAAYPELPFVLFTGTGSEAVASDAISADVTHYLQKRDGTEQYELLLNRIDNAVSGYRTERELERKNDLFETVQEIVDLGAWERDLRTDEAWWTEQVNRIFALSPEDDLTPEEALEFLHPDDRPKLRSAFGRAAEEGHPYDLELRIEDDDGSSHWLRAMGEPQVEDGEVFRVRGILQDITDRKRRQAVLKALHRVATEIQTEETIDEACERTVRAATDILEMDLCTILVRDGEWLVPRATSSETLPEGSRPMRIDQGLAGKTYQTGESHIVDDAQSAEETDPARETYQSGLSVPIGNHGVFQAVSTERGAFDADDVEFVELLVSHTNGALERIERERELERQNERLQEFASIVSHDLRNPLNVAQLQLRLARESDGETDDNLDAVEQSHERIEELIDDLLSLAQAGEQVDEVSPVALDEVALRGWHTVETENATLEAETGATVVADGQRLQQLFENLFRNAVEHSSTGPDSRARQDGVTVRVGDTDGGFFVADDGPGIPADERGSVFESGYTTDDAGTGFGLAIVEDIVEAHDWEIRVTESESGGARFEITGVQVQD